MNKLRDIFLIKEDRVNITVFILLLFIAYVFSVAVRFYWVYYFGDNAQSLWNGEVMINTNDGYYWAEGARDILRGNSYYQMASIDSPISILTAFFVKILPFSLDTIILYMPAFLGSLLILPIMLIGRSLNQNYLGFIAALIASIAWSYYNRTMIGYYDTDMLIIVLPTLVLWSLILGVTHNKNRYLLITAFSIIIYSIWYPGSYSLNIGMAGMLFLYTLIFDRKNIYCYKLMLFMAIAIVSIPVIFKILISIVLFLVFHFLKEKVHKIVIPLLILGLISIIFTGGLAPIIAQLESYVFRSETSSALENSLHFFNVVQTVREAGSIPFEVFANRISGHTITFFLSTIGYIFMVIRFPVMLLALPMIGLGFLALSSGLRFTVYAVPINALGLGFFIFLVTKFIAYFFSQQKQQFLKIIAISIMTIGFLYPNIKHVIEYKVPTVFNKQEVEVLDKLKNIASREDYVISWWDYGYPIRYYADIKTQIDGARHSGTVNYPVSYSLTYPQVESRNMAILSTEYTELSFNNKRVGSHIQQMMDDYNFTDPNLFLKSLKNPNFKLPKKTRDIYYYLPLRMLNIYPTVRLFSNLDLATGKQLVQPFLYQANGFQDTGVKIILGNGIEVDKKTNKIKIGNQQIPLNSLFVTGYDNAGKLHTQKQIFNFSAPISVIFMKNYNKFLVLDQDTLNSTYIQLFVFENYDKELFEPVIMDPLAKVYRLKL